MLYKIAQAIGLNTDQEAALVVSSQDAEGSIFLAVLKLTCDDAFTKGRQALSDLEDFYLEENFEKEGGEGNVATRLKDTFTKAQERLTETENYNLVLAVITGKLLYFISQGEVSISLKRGDKISSLSAVAASEQLVSGFLNEGDRLLFATTSLIHFLGDHLDNSLDLSLEEWEEETNSKVGMVGQVDPGLAGVIVDASPQVSEQDLIGQESAQIVEEKAVSKMNFSNPFSKFANIFSKIKFPKKNNVEPEDNAWKMGEKDRFNLKRIIPQSGRVRIVIGLVLILIVALGAGLQFKKIKDTQRDGQFAAFVTQAKENFAAAQTLQSLSPVETKNKLEAAKDSLNKALKLKPEDTDALNLKKQISEDSDKILQQFASADFPLFLDLDLVKKDFKADYMSLSGPNLLLLDPSSKTLISIDVTKKSNKILAGESGLGDGSLSSINGNFAFVYSLDKGVLRVDLTNQKVISVAKHDNNLDGAIDIAGFGSNIYVLDKTGNQIWKYLPTSDGYSDKREYLNKDVKADFAGAKRMQIESSVYILKDQGEILRFTKGAADFFSIGGLDKPVKEVRSIFTSSDVDNLYILDAGNSRLVVLDKKGAYKAQYGGDKFGIVSDLVVDEKNKKVYLLDGGKIYSTDLK